MKTIHSRPSAPDDRSADEIGVFESHVDGTTAVVLLDCVLGYGSNADPAGAVAESVNSARAKFAGEGKELVVVASVCGTDKDPQDLEKSVNELKEAGVIVMPSNMQAVRLVDRILARVSE